MTGDVVDSAGTVVGTATITDPATGAFTVVMTDLTYIGEVFFDYTITDPSGDTDSATVTLDLVPDTNGPANDPPVAENDTVTGTKNSPVSGSLLTNDTDPNAGDTSNLTVTDINGTAIATNGTTSISLSDGTLVYDADTNTFEFTPTTADFVGSIQIPYTISDNVAGDPLTDIGVLTISYFDNPPLAQDDINTTETNVSVSGNVLTNDSDPNPDDDLTVVNPATGIAATTAFTITTTNAGTVAINPDGTLSLIHISEPTRPY